MSDFPVPAAAYVGYCRNPKPEEQSTRYVGGPVGRGRQLPRALLLGLCVERPDMPVLLEGGYC